MVDALNPWDAWGILGLPVCVNFGHHYVGLAENG